MNRSLKVIEISGRIFLYPYPVIRDQKYLIQCDSMSEAESLRDAIAEGSITHPDEARDCFLSLGLHVDGKTPIISIKA